MAYARKGVNFDLFILLTRQAIAHTSSKQFLRKPLPVSQAAPQAGRRRRTIRMPQLNLALLASSCPHTHPRPLETLAGTRPP